MKREGVVYGMPEDEYHGQGAFKGKFRDEISSTRAKSILRNEAKFKYELEHGSEHKDAYDIGTAVHTKILGVGHAAVTCPKEFLDKTGGMRTNAAKAWKEEQQAAGRPVVSAAELVAIDAMAESVLAKPAARMLLERPGQPEVSVFDTWLGVKRRGRFDYLPDEGGIAVDLKSAQDASKRGFEKASSDWGYHIQRGHYLHIMRQLGRDMDMLFIVVEKTAPYLTAVHRMNEQFIEMGDADALEAIDRYKRCVDSGVWPGYQDEPIVAAPPMYLIYDFQDRYEQGEIQIA